eukprot:6206171-Pleurochrysis_carterae.AAC.6
MFVEALTQIVVGQRHSLWVSGLGGSALGSMLHEAALWEQGRRACKKVTATERKEGQLVAEREGALFAGYG